LQHTCTEKSQKVDLWKWSFLFFFPDCPSKQIQALETDKALRWLSQSHLAIEADEKSFVKLAGQLRVQKKETTP